MCLFVGRPAGDGYCDVNTNENGYNTAACGWDGGDCCNETCVSSQHACGAVGFRCLDPNATSHRACAGRNSSAYGDGFCDLWVLDLDLHLNTDACGWDGGDCCPSTCADPQTGGSCTHNVWECLDPNATDFGNRSECFVNNPSYVGDGYCDTESNYNTHVCGWDGGDCCAATCVVPPTSAFTCGENNFVCADPNVNPPNTTTATTTTTTKTTTTTTTTTTAVPCDVPEPLDVGDGYCDMNGNYNTASCGWDGGDCCVGTCVSQPGAVAGAIGFCGSNGFDCKDPDPSANIDPSCVVDKASYLGDGYCDALYANYNSANCSWDGGDCCEDTCPPDRAFECGVRGFVVAC